VFQMAIRQELEFSQFVLDYGTQIEVYIFTRRCFLPESRQIL